MNAQSIYELLYSPIITLASLLIAAVGVALATIFYFKSRREKKVRYSHSGRTLLEAKGTVLNGLAILYGNDRQERVTVSKLGIWNAGTEVLKPDDIASADPLVIAVMSDADVLSAKVVYRTEDSNQFSVGDPCREGIGDGETKTVIPFNFEYLDVAQGAVVQIVHTGTWTDRIIVRGKIVGGRDLERVLSAHQRLTRVHNRLLRTYDDPRSSAKASLLAGGVIMILGLIALIFPPAGLAIALLGLFGIFSAAANFMTRVPKDIFDNMR